MKDAFKLIAAVAVSGLAGAVGSLFTAPAIPTWYAALAKPSFAPPNWLFGPVWTVLYLLMGVAAFLVWKKGWNGAGVRRALGAFLLQLALNALWSAAFFGLRSPLWGLADIAALWLAIVATMVLFYKVSKPAAWLLLPYLLWVSFAACLNYSLWTLN
ncbi:MAG: tryptophan-rich sensory protein [Patescibacteria group bacterium]|nr:tryptophan-rich sensory protein [Patescibacteria group bacterium]